MCLPFLKLFLHQITERFYPTMKKTKLVPCTVVRACGCKFLFLFFSITGMTESLLTILWLTRQATLNKTTGAAPKYKQERRPELHFPGKRPTPGTICLIHCYSFSQITACVHTQEHKWFVELEEFLTFEMAVKLIEKFSDDFLQVSHPIFCNSKSGYTCGQFGRNFN